MHSHDFFHSIHQLSRQLIKSKNEVLQPFGLYSAQWSVLYVLKTRGTLTQKELSDYLSVEAPPMTRTIQRLVRQGFVQQVTGSDKRTKKIELTTEAIAEYPKWEKAVIDMNESILQHFSQNATEQLHTLISDLTDSINHNA